jgi:hypothetical protein
MRAFTQMIRSLSNESNLYLIPAAAWSQAEWFRTSAPKTGTHTARTSTRKPHSLSGNSISDISGAVTRAPIYPFCIVLASAAAAALFTRSVVGRIGVAALLLLTVFSSLHSYPNFLVYSNELNSVLGQTLLASGRIPEGQQAMAKALRLARANHPDYQTYLINQFEDPQTHP